MLVALYRSGPLRQRLAKGYQVVSFRDDPKETVRALLSHAPKLAPLPDGGSLVLRGSTRTSGTVWIDTGQVFLYDPLSRSRVTDALAESVAVTAAAVERLGAFLVPNGWSPGGTSAHGTGTAEFCGDVHSLEVLNEVQRELVCNLLREHSPALIALTGRQLHGSRGGDLQGSARLARSTDQITTRYIASFAPQHMERVRANLRREERVSRLETMDINPLGDAEAGAGGDVTLRLIDAQLTIASAMGHALLVQALAMKARDLERAGRRVGAVPQQLLERNRSRAIAHGLTAEFDVEQRTGDKRTKTRGGKGFKESPKARRTAADRVVRSLLRELLPYFRQLDASVEELGPLLTGLELSVGTRSQSFVRNENDLVAWWREQDATALDRERIAAALRSPDWLRADHMGEANRSKAPGSTAATQAWLEERLSPSAAGQDGAGSKKGHKRSPRPKARGDNGADQRQLGERLLRELQRPGIGTTDAVAALRSHCGSTAFLDLARPLRSQERTKAKALRGLLRPRPERRFRCDEPLSSWEDPVASRAVRSASETGTALLVWDVPDTDRSRVRSGLRSLGRPPQGLSYVLLTDTAYTLKADQRRGTVEVLLVAYTEESTV